MALPLQLCLVLPRTPCCSCFMVAEKTLCSELESAGFFQILPLCSKCQQKTVHRRSWSSVTKKSAPSQSWRNLDISCWTYRVIGKEKIQTPVPSSNVPDAWIIYILPDQESVFWKASFHFYFIHWSFSLTLSTLIPSFDLYLPKVNLLWSIALHIKQIQKDLFQRYFI